MRVNFMFLASLCIAILASAPGVGGEVPLETFSGEMAFGPRWSDVAVELGDEAGHAFVRAQTRGSRSNLFVVNSRPYAPTFDLEGKFLKVWIKLSDLRSVASMEFRLSSDRFESSYFAFGFPRYIDPDANIVRDGVWTPITFSFGSARVVGHPDRSAIDSLGWFLEDSGSPLEARWGGISAVDEPAAGVVSLTFDDGYDEHHDAARWMAAYGFRGTAYVIPSAVGAVGYMSLGQLRELDQRFGWEVAAHHETPFTDFSDQALESTVVSIKRFLVANGFGRGAPHLAYPLGRQDPVRVLPLVRKHFASARVAVGGFETLPPSSDHLLRVMNVTNQTSPAEIGAAARRARDRREWLILMFHYLVEAPAVPTEYRVEDFKLALREIDGAGVSVAPLAEVWSRCPAAAPSPCDPLGAPFPAARADEARVTTLH